MKINVQISINNDTYSTSIQLPEQQVTSSNINKIFDDMKTELNYNIFWHTRPRHKNVLWEDVVSNELFKKQSQTLTVSE